MPRSGFTLLEMILVMMLIVIAASFAAPMMDSLLHPNQVGAAIDAVRTSFEQTRARAMEEGRPFRFSVVEGGDNYKIEPDDTDVNPDEGFTVTGKLPEPCLFVPNGTGIIDPGTTASQGGALKSVAVFLPDGTARDDVDLSFGRPGLARATLRLRAITGAVNLMSQPKGN